MAWLDVKGRDIGGGAIGAPFQSNPTFGAVSFLDGPFQVGGAGNTSVTPESVSAPTMPQGYRSPADLQYGGLYGSSSSVISPLLLIIRGVGPRPVFFLQHPRFPSTPNPPPPRPIP